MELISKPVRNDGLFFCDNFIPLFIHGPAIAILSMAFNRILDFSNGLDFYLGFFYDFNFQTQL
jgi:hypothetical protein